jgi:hypothetical protein
MAPPSLAPAREAGVEAPTENLSSLLAWRHQHNSPTSETPDAGLVGQMPGRAPRDPRESRPTDRWGGWGEILHPAPTTHVGSPAPPDAFRVPHQTGLDTEPWETRQTPVGHSCQVRQGTPSPGQTGLGTGMGGEVCTGKLWLPTRKVPPRREFGDRASPPPQAQIRAGCGYLPRF